MDNKSEFIDFVHLITERPGMFQINRVEDISLVLFGYTTAMSKAKDKTLDEFLVNFRKFVNKDFETTDKYFSWEKLIRLYAGSDAHSIELFRMKFDQYLETLKR